MKRYGEKATREALKNGATIRYNEYFTADPGYRVRMNGETLGYIIQDLFLKLRQDGTIERTAYGYNHEDYTMTAQAAEKHPFSVAACVAHIRSFHVELKQQDAKATHDDLKHSEELNGPFFNRNMWKAFAIVFPDFVEEEQQPEEPTTEAQETDWDALSDSVHADVSASLAKAGLLAEAQEQPKSEDEENREYAQRIAQEVENYHRGHLRRCPCCEAIVERDDWDDLDVFTCPHCDDLDDVGQWEALTLHDYLEDVLEITYVVQSDRQTLDGAKFYVTLGGPSVWLDTCSRSVELRWGGRSASWGLTWEVCEDLDEIAQEYWDMG